MEGVLMSPDLGRERADQFPVRYDYSTAMFGGMPSPADDTAVQDEHGRWRIALQGDPDKLMPGSVYPTRELANNRIARRQATYEGNWRELHRLEKEMDELRRTP